MNNGYPQTAPFSTRYVEFYAYFCGLPFYEPFREKFSSQTVEIDTKELGLFVIKPGFI